MTPTNHWDMVTSKVRDPDGAHRGILRCRFENYLSGGGIGACVYYLHIFKLYIWVS